MGCTKSRHRSLSSDEKLENFNESRETCGCWTAIRKSLSKSKRVKSVDVEMNDETYIDDYMEDEGVVSDVGESSVASTTSINSADAFERTVLCSSSPVQHCEQTSAPVTPSTGIRASCSAPADLGQESEQTSAPVTLSISIRSSCSATALLGQMCEQVPVTVLDNTTTTSSANVEDEEQPSTSYARDGMATAPIFLPYRDDDSSSYESSSSESDDVNNEVAVFEDVVDVVEHAEERFILRASLVWTLTRVTYHFVFLTGLQLHGPARFRFFLPDLRTLPQAHLQIMDDGWGVWAGERDDEDFVEEGIVAAPGETPYLAPQGTAGLVSMFWAFIDRMVDVALRVLPQFDVGVDEHEVRRQDEEEEEEEEDEEEKEEE